MAQVIAERVTAMVESDFVVLLIGLRINKPWKVHKWIPVAWARYRMLKELGAQPECGLLNYVVGPRTIVQYWRSFEDLEAYARSKDRVHWPAWVEFNKIFSRSRGDVGIWHETYTIKPGQYEAVYSGMPPFGLGKIGNLVPASGRKESARQRLAG